MTREEFVKRSYKPYMIVFNTRLKEECMLLAVDFESELMTLQLLASSDYYIENKYDEFPEHISFIDIPKKHPKLKAL